MQLPRHAGVFRTQAGFRFQLRQLRAVALGKALKPPRPISEEKITGIELAEEREHSRSLPRVVPGEGQAALEAHTSSATCFHYGHRLPLKGHLLPG